MFNQDQLAQLLRSEEAVKATQRMANTVQRKAKRLCPVATGRLRSSITTAVGQDGDGVYGLVGSDVEYAAYVELGTSRRAATPYLVPAVLEVTAAELARNTGTDDGA